MGFVMRLTAIGLGASMFIVTVALIFGLFAETDAITDHHTHEDQTYTLSVRDSNRELRLLLAGTRCFGSIPAWANSHAVDDPVDPYRGQFMQTRDDDPWITVSRLGCP